MKKDWMIVLSGLLAMLVIMACGISFGDTGLSDEEKLQTAVAATIAANQLTQGAPTQSDSAHIDNSADQHPGWPAHFNATAL